MNVRPQERTIDEMAHALFVTADAARNILQELAQERLITADAGAPLVIDMRRILRAGTR